MNLRELSIQTEFGHRFQKRYNMEAWCVQEHFWSKIRSLKTGKVKKVVVQLFESEHLSENEIEDLGGVITVNKRFDFDAYFKLSAYDRKAKTLKVLADSMVYVAKLYEWNVDQLLDAYSACIQEKLEYEWHLQKANVRSPDRMLSANVFCRWSLNCFEAFAVFFNSDKQLIARKKLVKTVPHLGDFIYYTSFYWMDNDTIVLQNKDGSKKWTAQLH